MLDKYQLRITGTGPNRILVLPRREYPAAVVHRLLMRAGLGAPPYDRGEEYHTWRVGSIPEFAQRFITFLAERFPTDAHFDTYVDEVRKAVKLATQRAREREAALGLPKIA